MHDTDGNNGQCTDGDLDIYAGNYGYKGSVAAIEIPSADTDYQALPHHRCLVANTNGTIRVCRPDMDPLSALTMECANSVDETGGV